MKIRIKDDKAICVKVPTRKKYDELMRTLEDAGFRWPSGSLTDYDGWDAYQEYSVIALHRGLFVAHANSKDPDNKKFLVISLKEFYKQQWGAADKGN